MILVLFGPPGSGKGTQAEFLKKEFSEVYHFSSGAFLRGIINSNSDAGVKFSSYIDKGELIPDREMTEMVFNKLKELLKAPKNGNLLILLDGFPRSLQQANALIAFCEERKEDLFVLNIELTDQEIMNRLLMRVNCNNCKAPFSLSEDSNNFCPFCRGKDFSKRSDDSKEIILNRIANYRNVSQEMLNFFDDKNIFIVDGNFGISDVSEKICGVVSMLLKENF